MTKIIFFRFSKTKPDETMKCELKKKSFMSCSHVCSVRDRRHRFPSLIDAFLSVHDRFHFRFDRFLDRFRFLQHDDDE